MGENGVMNPLLFRIIHLNNLEYVLKNGMFTRGHINADPNYINIGDSTLITQRQAHPVGIVPPGGSLGDYVPFYFGPLSPMLLNIKTGYRGIVKRPQTDIVYICCRFANITKSCKEWCFTDGHAKDRLTAFYNNKDQLEAVDWNMVGQRYWRANEEDIDRMRRKQAEFLVKNQVPVECISGIIVYDSTTEGIVKKLITELRLSIPVIVKSEYYY
ncbi:DUF4433 domain-containing protein [Chitinophaga sancti]|uniref:type II toxin-antitoxin system toxin DNA ADP-ribosyl transferase DarT n=1 Tax=Chitinophaga sancti TaxID=1004 RepID=UPI002A765F88|nr:DUF4433 domain-containing protein [Chitinophaga sancti]WPQ64585.1 DUF4433 domain-containing protein [Chitinophaga sancti]